METTLKAAGAAPAGGTLSHIIDITRQPGGFSKLSPLQRRHLLAAILASIIPSDGKVLDVELQHFLNHLRRHFQFQMADQKSAMAFLSETLTEEQLQQAAKQLPELLNVEDRVALIGMLWDIAMCDKNLHPNEERMIYAIADTAGVGRKRVIEQQSRVARAAKT